MKLEIIHRPNILIPFVVIVLLLFGNTASAIDPPLITCASVNLDGSITFEWEPSTDPTVEGYQLYQSDDTFVVDISGGNTTTYTYTGLNANNQQFCFYMLAYGNGGTEFSNNSEVTCTLFIETTPSVTPVGYVEITIHEAHAFWTNPPNESYTLFLSKDGGPMEQVDYTITSVSNIILYNIIDCTADYEFMVFLNDYNCVSNRDINTYHDTSLPVTPSITSLYVDSTNLDIYMNWSMPSIEDEPSMANVAGFIIYECTLNNGNYISIPYDTIYIDPSDNNTSFSTVVDSTSLSSFFNPSLYSIAAFDSCLDNDGGFANLSAASECNSHIFLEAPTFDCDYIVLRWLPYIGWSSGWDDAGGVLGYEVLIKEDNQPEVSLGYSNLSNFDGTHYVDTLYNLDLGSNFVFYIKGHSFNFGYTALSNAQTVNLTSLDPPERTYLGSASVVAPNEIEITIKTDTTIREHDYVIQKREETNDVYQDLVTLSNASENFLYYTDTEDLETNKFTYEYRVIVINYCGDTVATTNSARTMLASAHSNNSQIANSVIWSPYHQFANPIDEYKIFRSNVEGILGDEIATLSGSTTSYVDDLESSGIFESNTNGYYCYTIVANESPGNIHNYQGESYSNQICTQFEPLIYIPNAFMVNGENNVFAPVISFANSSSYSMEIYSRSGNLIFYSDSLEKGWDGKNDGTEMADGAYIYVIRFKDGQGQLHERTGMVFKLSR